MTDQATPTALAPLGTPEAAANRIVLLLKGGEQDAALAASRRCLVAWPDAYAIHALRGTAFTRKPGAAVDPDIMSVAIRSFDRSLQCFEGNWAPYLNRGLTWLSLRNTARAIRDFQRVIEIDPTNLAGHQNLIKAAVQAGAFDLAQETARRSMILFPGEESPVTAYAQRLKGAGAKTAAARWFRRALILDRHSAHARLNFGFLLLQFGSFARGWEFYEARRDSFPHDFSAALTPRYEWHPGVSLRGKTLLVHSEQGLGDTLQCVRYLRHLKRLGPRVVLRVQPALVPLLRGLDEADVVVSTEQDTEPFHHFVHIMSLPLKFRTDFDTIPYPDGYLSAPEDRLEQWRPRLARTPGDKVIGIAWTGSRAHLHDRSRNLSFERFMSCVPDDVRVVVLQTDVRDADREPLAACGRALDLSGELRDFADTAALCHLVDWVVSIDTSLVHLAGALGRPVTTLVPFDPDWRWLLERRTSPWYASMNLVRQTRPDDWRNALSEVKRQLKRKSAFGGEP